MDPIAVNKGCHPAGTPERRHPRHCKLERLSHKAAFLLTLRGSGVRFLAVDMPEANDLTVKIIALVARAEHEAILPRTKEALAVAKGRGSRWATRMGRMP